MEASQRVLKLEEDVRVVVDRAIRDLEGTDIKLQQEISNLLD